MELNIEKAVKNGVDKALNEIELCIGMTLKEAVEKQVPQKAYCSLHLCPVCDGFIEAISSKIQDPQINYCIF